MSDEEEVQQQRQQRQRFSCNGMSVWITSAVVVGCVLLLAVGLTIAQLDGGLRFPDEHDGRSQISRELELAQMINEMESMDEFIKYVKGENATPLPIAKSGIISRMGDVVGQERSKADRPIPANCKPELQPVSLKVTENPSTLYYPSCTRIKRCGGCCTHARLSCQPVASEVRNFEVMVVSLSGGQPTIKDKLIVPLEEHTKCKCDCKIKEEDCTEKQTYVLSECACRCNNNDEEQKCLANNNTKIWNPDLCICVCREEQECSTGYYFDQNTCRCALKK